MGWRCEYGCRNESLEKKDGGPDCCVSAVFVFVVMYEKICLESTSCQCCSNQTKE